jgi:hypothetical protein
MAAAHNFVWRALLQKIGGLNSLSQLQGSPSTQPCAAQKGTLLTAVGDRGLDVAAMAINNGPAPLLLVHLSVSLGCAVYNLLAIPSLGGMRRPFWSGSIV